jgi:hypothetical protein
MSGGSLVGLANDAACTVDEAVDCSTSQDPQGGERHCERNKGTGFFEDGAQGVEVLVHWVSSTSNDTLVKRRPNDISHRLKVARAALQKSRKLLGVALSPGVRIEACEQVSEAGVHQLANLRSPALVNCCRVVSLARRTSRPSPVMR